MSRRQPYASRNNTSSSSVDLSNFVEESELESLLGTAASKDYAEVIEFGSTLSDSTSFVPSSKTVRDYLNGVIAALNLGTASTQGVTNSIALGLPQLPTSGAVWLYLQPYIEQLTTVSQWGPPTPAPTVF
eukprot:4140244-Pleurochrysis_carterae.AAC.2